MKVSIQSSFTRVNPNVKSRNNLYSFKVKTQVKTTSSFYSMFTNFWVQYDYGLVYYPVLFQVGEDDAIIQFWITNFISAGSKIKLGNFAIYGTAGAGSLGIGYTQGNHYEYFAIKSDIFVGYYYEKNGTYVEKGVNILIPIAVIVGVYYLVQTGDPTFLQQVWNRLVLTFS